MQFLLKYFRNFADVILSSAFFGALWTMWSSLAGTTTCRGKGETFECSLLLFTKMTITIFENSLIYSVCCVSREIKSDPFLRALQKHAHAAYSDFSRL